MRKAFASLLGATVLVVIASAACANSTADIGDGTDGEFDSGASTNPSPSSTSTGSNTFSDSGSTSSGTDSGSASKDSGSSSSTDSGSTASKDSGSTSTGTDSGSTSTGSGDVCDTSGVNGAIYFGEYFGDGPDGPCPCSPGDCCYESLGCVPE